jgi:hypothetical protein
VVVDPGGDVEQVDHHRHPALHRQGQGCAGGGGALHLFRVPAALRRQHVVRGEGFPPGAPAYLLPPRTPLTPPQISVALTLIIFLFFVFMLLVKAKINVMAQDEIFKGVCLAILTVSTFCVPVVIILRRLRWSVSSEEEEAEDEEEAAAEEEAARKEAEERAAEAALAEASGKPKSFRGFGVMSSKSLKRLSEKGSSIGSAWWRADPQEHPSLTG